MLWLSKKHTAETQSEKKRGREKENKRERERQRDEQAYGEKARQCIDVG